MAANFLTKPAPLLSDQQKTAYERGWAPLVSRFQRRTEVLLVGPVHYLTFVKQKVRIVESETAKREEAYREYADERLIVFGRQDVPFG